MFFKVLNLFKSVRFIFIVVVKYLENGIYGKGFWKWIFVFD